MAQNIRIINLHFHANVVMESAGSDKSTADAPICNTTERAAVALVSTTIFWPSGFSQAT
jgi:hypothetical protein